MSKLTHTAASTDTQLPSSSSTVTPSSYPPTSQPGGSRLQPSAVDVHDMSHVSRIFITGTAGGFTIHDGDHIPATVTAHASLHLQRATEIRDQMNGEEINNLHEFRTRLTAIVDKSNADKKNIGSLVSVRDPQTYDSYPNEGAFRACLDVGDDRRTIPLHLSQWMSNSKGLKAAKRDAKARWG